uniref:Protein kinase domain-containing protein n=1 Tax=Oryza rufipogon TaxID=4529 RepID=A0A0E0RBW2_ORYRU
MDFQDLEFQNEICFLGKLQHINVVKLLGYCIQGTERILVYEYMLNRSVDTFIFGIITSPQIWIKGARTRRLHLDWSTRSRIIHGIAEGLLYLHKHCGLHIVHGDLKPSNILLDSNMNPKISDFGLARRYNPGVDEEYADRILGSIGFIAPECRERRLFSTKSDVYGFGALVLEIISGKRCFSLASGDSGDDYGFLNKRAWYLWRTGRLIKLVDSPSGDELETREILRCIHIALLCVEENPANRPTMQEVVLMLSCRTALLPKPRRPAYLRAEIVANIAQLAGVDAYGLIKMIVEAAQTAKRNRETCQKLARHVKMIGDLLQRLQSTELMQHQETRNPVEQLEETLRHTYMLILSCQDSSYLHSCFMGGKQAHQLREVQSDITFYLQLFPLVSFVDTTRTWERLLRRAQPSCTESVTQCPEVFEEKRSEQTSIRSLNLDQLVVNDIGKGAVLTFSQILAATNNFSGRSLIGQGGFGPVYKGKLPNGLEIAVKRHDTSSHQGEEEFMAEIDVIPKLRRKNIIELIGFCVQGKECILVYEYIPNGNETKRILLNWSKRLKIIEGISDGLLYLHNHSPKCIVHRDIKASNILLDYEMNAKISDFGLAIKLAPKATTEVLVRGTWGYADPEYVATGVISEKTDVYSFGIVLLEIISGKLCVSGYNVKNRSRRTIFPEFALKNRKKLHKLIDPSLGAKKHERAQIMQCLRVAMLCVRDRAEHRPTMSEVVTMLPSIKTPKDRKFEDEIRTRR